MDVGQDTYNLRGSIDTTVEIAVGIDLQPKFAVESSTSYMVSVEPRVRVLFHLRDTDINLSSSGDSLLASVFTFVVGLASSIGSFVEDVVRGDSLDDAFDDFRDSVTWAIGRPFTFLLLNTPLRETLEFLLNLGVDWAIRKEAAFLTSELEDRIEESLRFSLRVDASGVSRFSLPITSMPSTSPSMVPSDTPSDRPSSLPSSTPTSSPSESPSAMPSMDPPGRALELAGIVASLLGDSRDRSVEVGLENAAKFMNRGNIRAATSQLKNVKRKIPKIVEEGDQAFLQTAVDGILQQLERGWNSGI